MAHDRVWTRRDDLLIRRYLDDGGRERVLFEHEKREEPTERDKTISGNGGGRRHVRPAEAMIERRHDEQAHKPGKSDRHDDLLAGLVLRSRPSAHPAFQKRRVLPDEINADGNRREEVNS